MDGNDCDFIGNGSALGSGGDSGSGVLGSSSSHQAKEVEGDEPSLSDLENLERGRTSEKRPRSPKDGISSVGGSPTVSHPQGHVVDSKHFRISKNGIKQVQSGQNGGESATKTAAQRRL